MNKKLIAAGTLSTLVLAGGFTGMVSAQSAAIATGLTEEQIIEIALTEVPGEVAEVELERSHGQAIFEVEIVDVNGVEMELEISADTGDILAIEAEGDDCDKDDETKDA